MAQSKDSVNGRFYYCFGSKSLAINFFLFIRKVLCLENHIYRKCTKHCKRSQGIWLEEVNGVGHLPQGTGILGILRNLTSGNLNCLQVLAAWLWGVSRSGHCKGREKLIETKEDPAERWEGLPKVSLYPLSFTFPFSHSVGQSSSNMMWAPSYLPSAEDTAMNTTDYDSCLQANILLVYLRFFDI